MLANPYSAQIVPTTQNYLVSMPTALGLKHHCLVGRAWSLEAEGLPFLLSDPGRAGPPLSASLTASVRRRGQQDRARRAVG